MMVIKSDRLRRVLRTAVPFVLIPALVAAGVFVFEQKRYAFVSLGVTLLSLLLFAAGYERKKVGTRRMVLVSVMVALSVAGRFIPLFKPVTALTVITGVWLGGEAGFLVGALSAVISNFYFGQGPWTPFQMLAWGLTGLFAGLLSERLKDSRLLLTGYGLASGLVYSFIMDIWTVLWYNGTLSWDVYLAALVTAIPHTIVYAVSNVIFLWFLAPPFGQKLERIKIKYGV